jgi:hypothetical protein
MQDVRCRLVAAVQSEVRFPWINVSVPVVLTYTDLTGEEHQAIAGMANWSEGLRTLIERACFANYLEKAEAIGAQPPTVPVIKQPSDIWGHINVKSVRPQGRDLVVVYAEPDWDENLHHEWCVQGVDRLLYVGQVLCYPAGGYGDVESGNSALNFEETITRLGHLPQQW